MIKKLAVTGVLACGKSSVCRFFEQLGAYVVSADEIVHKLLSPRTTLGKQVIHLLGSDIVIDAKISRSAISRKVFDRPDLLKELEALLHPEVFKKIEQHYRKACRQQAPLFVAEVPLLFEVQAEQYFDDTLTVTADQTRCIERYLKATGAGIEEYKKRMTRQFSSEEKAKRADFVINNDGSLKETEQQVALLFQKLT